MAASRPLYRPGPTGISQDAPEFFQSSSYYHVQPQSSIGELLSSSSSKVSLANELQKSAMEHPLVSSAKVTLDMDDLVSKPRDRDPASIEFRVKAGLEQDSTGFHRKLGSLTALAEASRPMRHLLPTQVSHQRLTCLAELLPRDVSSRSVTAVGGSRRATSPTRAGLHGLTMQNLHDASSLSSTLGSIRPRTRPTGEFASTSKSSSSFPLSPAAAEAGSTSPYKRDHWMTFLVDGKPSSPAGNPLECTTTSVTTLPSPVRPQTVTSSGTLLTLPGQSRRRGDTSPDPAVTFGSQASSLFSFGGDSAFGASTLSSSPARVSRVAEQLHFDHMKLAARGLMQTRNILRQSPRHGDGKVLGGEFAESGSWAAVLEPLRYKIAEPDSGLPGSPPGARSLSPQTHTPVPAPKKATFPSSPHEIEEALKELAAFEEDNNLAAASLLTRRELASKIKHSGKAASLGFATDDAVDAADRDALLAALERLRAATGRASPVASPTRAARPLHASNTRPTSRLTPRSSRRITTDMFKQ